MATPNVTYIRPELARLLPLYRTIRDCVAGSAKVKRAGDRYLPRPDPIDASSGLARLAADRIYESYKDRAVFVNATGRTVDGLTGEVFANEPTIELQSALEFLRDNVNGGGVSLIQQARKAVSYGVSYGRGGLLVDYPQLDRELTRAEVDSGDYRPMIKLYSPMQVINWRTSLIGGVEKLTLVVIAEGYQYDDDGFEIKTAMRIRALRLIELSNGGLGVAQYLYQEENPREWSTEGVQDNFSPNSNPVETLLRGYNGQPLQTIPFEFFGALNNDSAPDKPPIYDLAILNIAHYRNSADFEGASFLCGQPTLVAMGIDARWYEDVLGGVIRLGSAGGIPLPEGADIKLVQAEERNMPFAGMEHKERLMAAMGAKLIEQRQTQRTLGEAKLERSTDTSILATVTKNVSAAYRKAMEHCRIYIEPFSGEIEFSLSTDFSFINMSPEERAALLNEWQTGGITFKEYRDSLLRSGIATEQNPEAARRTIMNEQSAFANSITGDM